VVTATNPDIIPSKAPPQPEGVFLWVDCVEVQAGVSAPPQPELPKFINHTPNKKPPGLRRGV